MVQIKIHGPRGHFSPQTFLDLRRTWNQAVGGVAGGCTDARPHLCLVCDSTSLILVRVFLCVVTTAASHLYE